MISTPRRRSGYSLIELLVVMAIVGVLALVAVAYRMDRMGPAVKGALQDINGTLSDARTLARSSGQAVTLTPGGTNTTATLTYSTTPPRAYTHAADNSAANYCLVDMDGTGNPTADALTSLKTAIGAALGGVDVFPTAAWQVNAFHCTPALQFNTNGSANRAAYVAVIGQRNGLMMPDGPIGILLVSATGNMYRYYRASSTSSWTRL